MISAAAADPWVSVSAVYPDKSAIRIAIFISMAYAVYFEEAFCFKVAYINPPLFFLQFFFVSLQLFGSFLIHILNVPPSETNAAFAA
jgi:hypothetical protein